ARVARMGGETLALEALRLVPVAPLPGRNRREVVLPGRGLERLTARAADRQHGGSVLGGERAPLLRRLVEEDERPGRCVELLALDREDRVPGDDDVELFVVAGAVARLVVLLDDELARVRGVGVD